MFMADNNGIVSNVMPDALVEPITDMDMIVSKLKYEGKLNKHASPDATSNKKRNEVKE
jgi:hypothetical protein